MRKAAPIDIPLRVTLEDLYNGKEIEVRVLFSVRPLLALSSCLCSLCNVVKLCVGIVVALVQRIPMM